MDNSELILKYFPRITGYQKEQIELLGKVYKNWNQKINLISRKDMDALYVNHVLHSLAIARFIQFSPGSNILDAGTGGGFPGIPLAILFPEASFTLVDSIGKKIKAVVSISTDIGLKNVIALQERIEKLKGNYDFVVSRAVAPLLTIYKWSKDKININQTNERSNGIICLKGGDLSGEIGELNHQTETVDLKNYFTESFFETKKIVYIPV